MHCTRSVFSSTLSLLLLLLLKTTLCSLLLLPLLLLLLSCRHHHCRLFCFLKQTNGRTNRQFDRRTNKSTALSDMPMKETLRSKVFSFVEPYVDDGGNVQQGRVREVMDRIHTDVVRETMGRLAHNRVLNQRPPKVNPNEKTLPRKTRVILAQLRSGHCARLRDYQCKIGKVPDDRCQDCNLDTQNVEHLFSCPARRTGLSVEDLWTNPREVAFFLSSHPAFDCVPPPATPPPRRRRRRGRPPSSSRSSFSFSPLSNPDSLVLSPFSLSSLSP